MDLFNSFEALLIFFSLCNYCFGELIKFPYSIYVQKIMVRLICIPRVIRTLVQRQEVNRLTIELKNLQANPTIYKEEFAHLVNHITKFHEKVQKFIWVGALKISKN